MSIVPSMKAVQHWSQRSDVSHLKDVIEDHSAKFVDLCGNVRLRPKHNFLVHLAENYFGIWAFDWHKLLAIWLEKLFFQVFCPYCMQFDKYLSNFGTPSSASFVLFAFELQFLYVSSSQCPVVHWFSVMIFALILALSHQMILL